MSSEGRKASQLDAETEPAPAEAQGRIAELYVRHSSSDIRLAYLLTGDRQLAEDLMQEAFAKLIGRCVTSLWAASSTTGRNASVLRIDPSTGGTTARIGSAHEGLRAADDRGW